MSFDDEFKVEDTLNTSEETDDFNNDFDEFDDEFVDAGKDDDDDFGDFDDFEESPVVIEPKTPTEAELYVRQLYIGSSTCFNLI